MYAQGVKTLVVVLGLAILATGCTPAVDQVPTVRVSNWGGAGDDGPFERLIQAKDREFEVANGARVRKEGIPGEYVPKMLLNFVAGTQPDVMVVDASSAAVFQNNGMLQDLRPFIEKDPDFKLSDFYDNVLDTFRSTGSIRSIQAGENMTPEQLGDIKKALGIAGGDRPIYAIPNDFTPMVVYYNKDLFDAAGVAYPKDDWTFNDFLKTAQALTKKGQYGFAFGNWMPGWLMWLWNNGGDVLSADGTKAEGAFDSAENVETYSFIRDLIIKHKVSPSLSETASMGVDLFANGQAAMAVSGHWALVGYKNAPKKNGKPAINWERLGVVRMPHNTPESHTVLYMSAYGIPRGAKNPDLAWKYVKMWTSRALQTEYQTSGIAVCARKDVSRERAGFSNSDSRFSKEDPKIENRLEADFLPIIPTGRPPYGSRIEGYEIVEKMGTSAMQTILNGADVQQTLTIAAKRIDKEFAKKGS